MPGDDLDAANRIQKAIPVACAFLADIPLAGRIRQDLTTLPVRFGLVQPYRNHWIVYTRERASGSFRIIHRARNIPAILR
jgi:plasmid stabilization system protein ParE